MKRVFLSLMISGITAFSSCIKDDPEPEAPRTNVPTEMVGKWMYGSFNMIEFWNYDGSYDGPGFQLAVVFDFKQGGDYEYYFMAEANSYGCKTDAFTYHKGTVEFNSNNSFTIHPADGNFRGFYNCAPSSNFNRKPNPGELKEQTFYYGFEKDDYGKEYMVIRIDSENAEPSYFSPTEW
uniref:Lipocalin-like domain-containing protein n=1 Tax=Roseihalotalea indica TaxID=2867963 RepID=A0AA49GPV7_9BACT|nr:hypothetical protein K4G66_06130 [Tunicatimonas sp. TK19036]